MNLRTIIIFFFIVTCRASAQNPFEANYLSKQRLQEKDTAGYFYLAEQAYTLAPFNLEFTVNYARACVVTGKIKQSLSLLENVAVIGFDFGFENDSTFIKLRTQPKFKQIVNNAKANSKKTASNYAFSLKEKDIIPEGITYDPRQQKFYVSSIYKRKIVGINMDGTSFDFAAEAQDGLFSTLGMKVDAARNHLWVMGVMNVPRANIMNDSDFGNAAVYQFNLETKKLIQRYSLNDTLRHLFNDLVIVDGNVYLTDSENETIYKINTATQTFEPFYHWDFMFYPNGITVSQDQQHLFVAHWAGISRISLADTHSVMVQAKPTTTLTGIDGLYFYENNLIGIQNGAGPQSRIMKFELNKQMDAVTNATVLESQNPLYNIPTTGTIIDDELYFIANSQLQNFDAGGKIFPSEKMQPTYILKLKLSN